MPDDADHTELARLLADPAAWTPHDRETAVRLLAHQQAYLASVHPADQRLRTGAQRVVDRLDAAIRSAGP